MGTFHRISRLIVVWCAASIPAWAQPAAQANEWEHGTTLTGFAGVAVDSLRSGPMLGGAVGWEITPRVAIEGSGLWVEHGPGTDAFAGSLSVHATLFGPHKAMPFLQAGVGLYRASFEYMQDTMPRFYRDRIGLDYPAHGMGLDIPTPAATRTFTDPSVAFGGGVNVFVSRTVAIRPDVETMVVMRDSRTHVVTAVRIHIVYHFEDHPVTAARGPR